MKLRPFAVTLGLVVAAPTTALAATYAVGPGKTYASIQDTLPKLAAGDVVEVDGDHTYPGDLWIQTGGSAAAPITFRGISVNGHRPIIQGVGAAQYHNMIVLFYANHLVFENFEIVGDGNTANAGLVNKADDVTLRDLLVHGVAGQGLLGTDQGSGSLTLERSEFYGNGSGTYNHQIYMATDETMFPGSVFRMQYCYVHDGVGGNNVKSRAERNEIYYNWIEGAFFHELDLIGPDGQDPNLAREDSDVVGNVLVKHSTWFIARIGGDGTGSTDGRYRFVANTMVLGTQSTVAIGLQQSVATVEMHDNVIVGGASGATVWNYNDPEGAAPVFFGSHNWIQTGIGSVPASFTGTVRGADPGFLGASKSDYRPKKGSPLVDAGTETTSIASPPFVKPLLVPVMIPPSRAIGTEAKRPSDAKLDIGAFEFGSGETPGDGGTPSGPGSGGSAQGSGGSSFKNGGGSSGGGCGCRVASDGDGSPLGAAATLIAAAWLARRRLGRRTARC